MFIIVKYGDNKDLVCNPGCAVVNLLQSIKKRVGFVANNASIDLSDETGLIKDLDLHKHDYASKYLTSHYTYILVEKQLVNMDDENQDGSVSPTPPQYQYIPLLDKYKDLFPNYKVQVPEKMKGGRKMRTGSKSPSPAGRISSKSKKRVSQQKLKK